MDCGLELEDFMIDRSDNFYSTLHHSNRAQKDPKIMEEIYGLPVSSKCASWIIESLGKVDTYTHKHNNRSKIIFAYCYLYHLIQGEDFDPSAISTMLKMDPKSVNDAIHIVSGTSSRSIFNNYTSELTVSIVALPPANYVDGLIKSLSLDEEHTSKIKAICNYVIKIDELLLERNPKMIAAGVVHYFFGIMKWSTTNIGKRMGVTNPQSKSHSKMIHQTISEFRKTKL
jgi:hypothetical protein